MNIFFITEYFSSAFTVDIEFILNVTCDEFGLMIEISFRLYKPIICMYSFFPILLRLVDYILWNQVDLIIVFQTEFTVLLIFV